MNFQRFIIVLGISVAVLAFFLYNFFPKILEITPLSQSITSSPGHEEGSKPDDEKSSSFIQLTPEQMKKANIEVRSISNGSLKTTLSLPGRIVADPERYAHIVSKASGIVKEARKNLGDPVSAGEVIAVLESQDMAEAKGNYLAAARRLQLADALYNQEALLQEKKLAPFEDYLKAQTALEEAQITYELAKQHLFVLGLEESEVFSLPGEVKADFRLLEIRAPFDGTVLDRHLTIGEGVTSGQEVYVIADLRKVWVELGIYPKDAYRIKEGSIIAISRDDGQSHEASILRISPVIDTDTARIKTIALLDNSSGQWRPGSYICGKLTIDEVNIPLVVPNEAIMRIDNSECLFISHEEGFERRCIAVGRSDHEQTEVVAGVSPGERFASKNAFLLKFELMKGEPE